MNIIKKDPIEEIEKFFNDQDFFGFVPAVRRHMVPPIDIYHNDKEVVVEMHVPKIDPAQLNIAVEDGVLRIEGSTKEEVENADKEYYRRETRWGSFARAISLPAAVKEGQAKATYEKGILKVVIPKQEVKQPTKVEVEVK